MLILDWQRKLVVMGILLESQAKGVSAERTPAGGAPIWASEGGATANEYRLIAALIALACIITFKSLRLNLAEIFNANSNALRWIYKASGDQQPLSLPLAS